MSDGSREHLIFTAFERLNQEEQLTAMKAGVQMVSKTNLTFIETMEVLYRICRYINENPRMVKDV